MWKTFAWPTAGFLNQSSTVEFELVAAPDPAEVRVYSVPGLPTGNIVIPSLEIFASETIA